MKLNRVFVLVAATLVLGNLLTLYIAAIAALPHERPALAGTVRFVLRVVRATGFVKLDTPEHVATLARIVIWLASIGEVGSIVWLASRGTCVLSQRASADEAEPVPPLANRGERMVLKCFKGAVILSSDSR